MMTISVPDRIFDANGMAIEIIDKYNKNRGDRVLSYIRDYDAFWRLNEISIEQMQLVLNEIGIDRLTEISIESYAIIYSMYSVCKNDIWHDEWNKYLDMPYNISVNQDTGYITITGLKEGWITNGE